MFRHLFQSVRNRLFGRDQRRVVTDTERDNRRIQAEDTRRRLAARMRRYENELRELAGTHWDEMTESQGSAAAFLRHPKKDVRRAALSALSLYWKRDPTDDCAAVIKDVALNDSEPVVRAIALVVLGGFYKNTQDPKIGRLFAECIADDTESTALRKAAYGALCSLCGREDLKFVEREGESPRLFRYSDIDWGLVNRFLDPDGW